MTHKTLTVAQGPSGTDDARRLSRVPAPLQPGSSSPAAGPLDALSRVRLRRALAGYLGEFPTLDAHLDLLDTRGAWYAEKALGAWSAEHPDGFFGLVRHVVRTQLDGPPPEPDIEAWLAAGRPADEVLASTWDTMLAFRYPPSHRPETTGRRAADPAVTCVDDIVAAWPTGQLDGFLRAYGALEQILERRHFMVPPIDA